MDNPSARSTPSTAGAIGRATAVIMALGLLDKVLAVGKEVLMAARFGVDASVDAFNIAYAFPGIINLLFNGACVAAFVPLYTAWRGDGARGAGPDGDGAAVQAGAGERNNAGGTRDKTLTILFGSCLFFILLCLVCYALSPFLLSLMGYGFSPETLARSVAMERLLVWLVLLEGIGVTYAALLQSWKRFAALSVTQTFINAAIIPFLAFGGGLGVDALIYGFLAGTALKVAGMMACSGGMGLAPLRPFKPDFGAFREYALLAGPLLGSALIANSNILIDQSMSTSLPEGGVAILRYAYRVNDLPLQIIVIALSRAIFPFLSEQAATGDMEGMRKVFRMSFVFIALVAIPITCYVLVFAEEIVAVLLRRGAFGLEAASLTALTLRCYSIGLFFQAYAFINGSFFAALRQGRVLFRLGFLTLGLNFFFNWLFLRMLQGPHAIALSTAVTMAVISTIFLHLLTDRLGKAAARGLGKDFTLIFMASAAATAVCLPLRTWADGMGLSPWITLGALTFLFGTVNIAVTVRFRKGEVKSAVDNWLQWATSRRGKT
jgi:putative peptidoglycan lipid II flippase